MRAPPPDYPGVPPLRGLGPALGVLALMAAWHATWTTPAGAAATRAASALAADVEGRRAAATVDLTLARLAGSHPRGLCGLTAADLRGAVPAGAVPAAYAVKLTVLAPSRARVTGRAADGRQFQMVPPPGPAPAPCP